MRDKVAQEIAYPFLSEMGHPTVVTKLDCMLFYGVLIIQPLLMLKQMMYKKAPSYIIMESL